MLQLLGLVYLAWAVYQGIAFVEQGGIAQEYKWFGIGVGVFVIGRLMERHWGTK